MKYLLKILWKDQNRTNLIWAMLGTLAGFVLLLTSIQFFLNFNSIKSQNEDLLDPEFIVLNKRVNAINTISQARGMGQSVYFTQEEIDEIAAQPFAMSVTGFIASNFPVSAIIQSEQFPGFYTDLFFEAIPDEYIDVKSDDWGWEEGQEFLPVIVPQDYLNLYNFGFAQSQGLPQVPNEMISLISFRINLRNELRTVKQKMEGRIIGFSSRVNSILVPYSFLTWANEKFGEPGAEQHSSRVIVEAADPTDPEIIKFIQDKGYDTLKEKLKSSRLNIILLFVFGFLGAIAVIIIGLAFATFLLSLQLMISRSAEKIKKLSKIGYHYSEISKPYIFVLAILLITVTGISIATTLLISSKVAQMATEWRLEIEPALFPAVYLTGTGLILFLFALNTVAILVSNRKLCS